MVRRVLMVACCLAIAGRDRPGCRAGRGRGASPEARRAAPPVVLRPARVFDGINPEAHDGWAVVVRGDRIEAVGPAGEVKVPEGARTIDLPGRRSCRASSTPTRTCCSTPMTRPSGTTRS